MSADELSNSTPNHLKPGFHTPIRTATIGMYLFLASLFMLFAAGLLGYVIIRVNGIGRMALGAVEVPQTLWISTVVVLFGSVTIQLAVINLRREQQQPFRRWLLATLALAVAFVIVQVPSLKRLLDQNAALREKHIAFYGLIFMLILLHAAHVVGGIAALVWTSKRAAEGAYDHENYQPVGRVALYWHFLDAVWLAMFLTFQFVK
jgi:heme/copper-type cytochrome/quinol oxidase subunit 3